jgi:hypothetical protein
MPGRGESKEGVHTFTMSFSEVTRMLLVRRQPPPPVAVSPHRRAEPGETANQPKPAIHRVSVETVGNQPNPNQRFIESALKPSETNPARSLRYTRGLGQKLTTTRETRTMYRVSTDTRTGSVLPCLSRAPP